MFFHRVECSFGVAGGEPPALIERATTEIATARSLMCVAGGEPPALIERDVSAVVDVERFAGVAGGEPPALIERCRVLCPERRMVAVSPGVNPRPSLNGPAADASELVTAVCRRG